MNKDELLKYEEAAAIKFCLSMLTSKHWTKSQYDAVLKWYFAERKKRGSNLERLLKLIDEIFGIEEIYPSYKKVINRKRG